MAKFIIEVSDGYIKERADITNIINANKDEGSSLTKGMVELITFNILEREIEKGNSEFYLSSKDIEDEKILNLFNSVVTQMAAVITAGSMAKEKADEVTVEKEK